MIFRAAVFHVPLNPFSNDQALASFDDGALFVDRGRIIASGDYSDIRAAHPGEPVRDMRGGIILPGLIDTHIHYPQVRALGGIGHTLLDWLEQHTLPEESRFRDNRYAADVADEFLYLLASHGTTTAMVFGAHFAGATAILFEKARASGLRIASGLVLSDRNLRPELHHTPERAYLESTELIRRFHGAGRLLYAVTPRFALSASEAILDVCRTLMQEHSSVRFQTHLNENPDEIQSVAHLFRGAPDYLGAYEHFGLVTRRSVFAHSVHTTDSEITRMAAHSCSVAYCPASNAALGSGFFPFERHLRANVRIALGTDVGGGTGFGILKESLQAYLGQRLAPGGFLLTAPQLLYLCTLAGARAMGLENETGDFTPGKAADFVYLRPPERSPLAAVMRNAPDAEGLLAAVHTLGDAESIRETWVEGECVFQR
ncbi:MAG: guanine deaminase [Acidobacteria bacterium]|nr:guanine deaminase [Acidobacteriota bacterium]